MAFIHSYCPPSRRETIMRSNKYYGDSVDFNPILHVRFAGSEKVFRMKRKLGLESISLNSGLREKHYLSMRNKTQHETEI